MTFQLRRTLALAVFGVMIALNHSAFATMTISLVGIDMYISGTDGTVNNGGFRYSSNSNDFSFADQLTLGSSSQVKGINFALASGANNFSFLPDPNQVDGTGPASISPDVGFLFFFDDTGTSFNPTTDNVPADYAAYVPSGTSAFAITGSGTSIEDYGPGGGATTYSGAPSVSLDGQTVTLTALASDGTPAGTFTLTVTPEPATLSLLMMSSIGLLRRRRLA